jgi:hypothetical protein
VVEMLLATVGKSNHGHKGILVKWCALVGSNH